MYWFDWMTLAVVMGVAIIQTVRGVKAGGMGLPLFESAGLIVAAVASTNLSGGISESLRVPRPTIIIVLFLALAIGAFILGRWFFTVTNLSFESLDGFLSFVFGLVSGWTVAHMLLRVIVELQGPSGVVAELMPNAPIGREVFLFRGWNWLVQLLFKARLAPEFNPDVG